MLETIVFERGLQAMDFKICVLRSHYEPPFIYIQQNFPGI